MPLDPALHFSWPVFTEAGVCTEKQTHRNAPGGVFLLGEGATQLNNIELVLKDTIAEGDLQRQSRGKGRKGLGSK